MVIDNSFLVFLLKNVFGLYFQVLKVLNTSEENVMAFCGNFNRKADSHLVCVETDGTHSTQTISCRTSNKKCKALFN